jgi:hypothetical protein
MDIKTFVETSLTQIVEGVNNANTALSDQGAYVSSKNVRPLREGTTYNSSTGDLVNLIEFDIAVTVNEKDASEGGASIKVAGINIGGGLQKENTNQTVSRIKFNVPLTFPAIDKV